MKRTPGTPIAVYTLSVTVTRAIMPDDDETTADVAQQMISREAKRELEREVLHALRKLDGDCDCEVLDAKEGQE